MKDARWLLLGALCATLLSSALSGCCRDRPYPADVTLAAGRYLVDLAAQLSPDGGGADAGSETVDADLAVVLSDDRETVTQTFTREGKRYEVRFRVAEILHQAIGP